MTIGYLRRQGAPGFRDRERTRMFTDLLGTTSGHKAPFITAAISSGTEAVASAPDANHMGVTRWTSSSTNNSGLQIRGDVSSMIIAAGDYCESILNIVTLANLTLRCGFHDCTTSADAVDGVYFEVASTGVATFKTSNNSSRSSAGVTATLSAAVWYRFEVQMVSSADVRGRIFNSDTGAVVLAEQTLTTNIPTARTTTMGITATNSGAVATDMVDVDYFGYERLAGYERVR